MEFINNTPFVFLREGWYICGCGKSCVMDNIESHMSKTFKGFCENGIRIGKSHPYQCICGTDFFNDNDSSKHIEDTDARCMEMAMKLESRECKACRLYFNGATQLERHMKTQRHKSKIDHPLKCKICNIQCSSAKTYETHLKTKKHLARLETPPLDLECKICNIKCLSQKQMKAHLETNKHKKRIK